MRKQDSELTEILQSPPISIDIAAEDVAAAAPAVAVAIDIVMLPISILKIGYPCRSSKLVERGSSISCEDPGEEPVFIAGGRRNEARLGRKSVDLGGRFFQYQPTGRLALIRQSRISRLGARV